MLARTVKFLGRAFGAAATIASSLNFALADPVSPGASAQRLEQRIRELGSHGANPEGGVSRVAFSNADISGREYIKGLMQNAGLEVRVDTAGNVIGARPGSEPSLPPILFGSHIDSVPNGGNYDGDVGVIGAIEVIELLKAAGYTTRHPLEVVVFTDEEGGTVGSQAMAGRLPTAALDQASHSGMSVRDGIRAVGGDADKLESARRRPGEIKAFIELHIEQGGLLEASSTDIGVVEGIVGIRWWDITVEGMANHAGTTPMNERRDALLAAAELALAVNRIAATTPGRQVATVGRIRAEPGAPNVIPGRVVMSLEIRDLDATKIERVYQEIAKEAKRIEAARHTPVSFAEVQAALEPAPTEPRLRRIISEAAKALGLSHRTMPSGAGHDAQEMTHIAPTGMIFVPSVGGISHSPREFTSAADMANGVNVLLRTVLAIDGGALDE
jgi:N-carbamoyl-L-amino-acid hydrolase